MYNHITDFIKELYKSTDSFIPLHEPRFVGNEKKYLNDAIDSTYVSSVGAYVDRFEEMMVEITGAKYAVAIVNGTSALHIALKLAGVKAGDEVLSQALTFVATANAISYEKAIPHFIDVDEDTMGMSPVALRKRLELISVMKEGKCYNKETGARISCCVPMHTFGFPVRIDEIVTICNEFNIAVVEDAAESLGSYYKNQHTGTSGLLGTFSFNGNKTVTCGGGGAVVTNNEDVARRAKHLTTTAKMPHKWEYAHDSIAYNYRMPNINAALACAQLEQLERFIENKRETASLYADFFKGSVDPSFINEPDNALSNFWLNAVRFPDRDKRDNFLQFANDNNVMSRPIWKLMNSLVMFNNAPFGDLSVSEQLEDTIINIPSSVRL